MGQIYHKGNYYSGKGESVNTEELETQIENLKNSTVPTYYICAKNNWQCDTIGINNTQTLKEVCEAICTYAIANNIDTLIVNYWLNRNNSLGQALHTELGVDYGNIQFEYIHETIYLTYREYYKISLRKYFINTYTVVNDIHDFSGWEELVYKNQISNATNITTPGVAMDARQANADIEGSIANQLSVFKTDVTERLSNLRVHGEFYSPLQFANGVATRVVEGINTWKFSGFLGILITGIASNYSFGATIIDASNMPNSITIKINCSVPFNGALSVHALYFGW